MDQGARRQGVPSQSPAPLSPARTGLRGSSVGRPDATHAGTAVWPRAWQALHATVFREGRTVRLCPSGPPSLWASCTRAQRTGAIPFPTFCIPSNYCRCDFFIHKCAFCNRQRCCSDPATILRRTASPCDVPSKTACRFPDDSSAWTACVRSNRRNKCDAPSATPVASDAGTKARATQVHGRVQPVAPGCAMPHCPQ